MPSRNLMDDGAVIGYKPNLEYKKEMNNRKEAVENNTASVFSFADDTQYSQAITSFENCMPSKALIILDSTVNFINSLIENIVPLFNKGKNGDYSDIAALLTSLRYGNKEISDSFIKYHFDEISGSHVPEIIGELFETSQRIEILSSTLKELFYNDSHITIEDASEKDNTLLKNMKEYEIYGNTHKINYVAVAYDSIVGRSVIVYGNQIKEATSRLSDILFERDDICINPIKMPSVKRLFSELNDEITYRKDVYCHQQSVEIMQKTLYNYYYNREELLDLYELFSGSNGSVAFGSKIQRKQTHMRHVLEEITRSYSGNKYYLDEISKLEAEKCYLRDIYANSNYNLE